MASLEAAVCSVVGLHYIITGHFMKYTLLLDQSFDFEVLYIQRCSSAYLGIMSSYLSYCCLSISSKKCDR